MDRHDKLRRTNHDDALDLESFLPYRLSILSNTISTALAESYSERFGLSIPEWRVMAILGRYAGISAAQVAERTAMDKVAVSRAVSRLLKAGRIRRRFANADRRRSILELSPAGRRIYQRLTPMLLRYQQDLLAALDAGQRQQLHRILAQLDDQARRLGPPRID
jgi:DNA-binding MarR family transcriptional regulator